MSTQANKSMRSAMTAVLAAVMVLFTLTACAKAQQPAEANEPGTPEATAAATATAAPTATPEPTPDPAMAPVTFAWISDTQGYASSFPENLNTMTKWIVDNRKKLNIQYVIQSGDLVNDMLREREWNAVANAFDAFVGKIPVFNIAGNHDIKGMMHMYDDYYAVISRQKFTEYPTFGGEQDQGRRRFDLVTIGHENYIIIGVGYNIQRVDYDWLNATLAKYADRTAILVAHWYMELKPETELIADSDLLHRVVAANPNVRYVLCGHRHGLRHVEEMYDDDKDGVKERTVQAIMVDYQSLPNGGDGYFMLLTFDPLNRTFSKTSYSPVLDDYNYFEDESIETFTMPLSTVGTD
ncbi:MAG TPA: metallophosphoesterase [Clostridia bacterium]|nr:metallophosphoesterase [Clostridia bacterium]